MNKFNSKTVFIILSCVFIVLLSGNVFAQSNDIVDELLLEEEATFGKTVYLVLVASSIIADESSIDNAVTALQEQEWKIETRGKNEPIKLGELSLVLMKSLEINGGLMYKITSNARYACRELSYLGLVIGNSSPYRTLSGEEALMFISRVIDWKQNQS